MLLAQNPKKVQFRETALFLMSICIQLMCTAKYVLVKSCILILWECKIVKMKILSYSPFRGPVVQRQKNPPNSSGQNGMCVLAAISQRATDQIFILMILHSLRITIQLHDLTNIWPTVYFHNHSENQRNLNFVCIFKLLCVASQS